MTAFSNVTQSKQAEENTLWQSEYIAT